MFSKKPSAAEASESVYMRERVRINILVEKYNTSVKRDVGRSRRCYTNATNMPEIDTSWLFAWVPIYPSMFLPHQVADVSF